MSSTKTNKRAAVAFMAIDQYAESHIVSAAEKNLPGQNRVIWGEGNRFPDYLLELYENVPTLGSIINGNVDYIAGDDVSINAPDFVEGVMNGRGDTIQEQIRDIAKDFELYGGFCLEIIRNAEGSVAEVNYLDMRFVRMNKDCNVFYYCEDWGKSANSRKVITYPAFMPELDWFSLDEHAREEHAASILFVKNIKTQTYPMPMFRQAIKSCEIERCIDEYHLNSINNGFTTSTIINFNNGIPDDEQKDEIEREVNEKFGGYQNAGRIMVSFNPNKESAATFETPKVEDFGERYQALAKHSRQQIFTSFRANPNLFGIPTENNGFSNDEYAESFKLYNRTQIRPIQRKIADAYDKIFGIKGVLTIVPFSMESETETNVN